MLKRLFVSSLDNKDIKHFDAYIRTIVQLFNVVIDFNARKY